MAQTARRCSRAGAFALSIARRFKLMPDATLAAV